jgi:hypothetical protein
MYTPPGMATFTKRLNYPNPSVNLRHMPPWGAADPLGCPHLPGVLQLALPIVANDPTYLWVTVTAHDSECTGPNAA